MRVQCRHCRQTFRVKPEAAGKSVICPNLACRKRLLVQVPAARTPGGPPVSHAAPLRSEAALASPPAARRSRPRFPRIVWAAGAALLAGAVVISVASLGRFGRQAGSAGGIGTLAAASEPGTPSRDETFEQQVAPFFAKYCTECHGEKTKKADVTFHDFTGEAQVTQDRDKWETVLQMLETGSMPPDDRPQPSAEERKRIFRWVESKLYHLDCTLEPDPGRVTVRRLNRTEYNNTIRDLVGVEFQPADDFPSDDVGEGFDNIGDVLSMSPLLFEKYVEAAERIAEAAIAVVDTSKAHRERRERKQLKADGGVRLGDNGVFALYSNGNVSATFDVPRDGEYVLRAEAGAQQAGPEIARMEMHLDGKQVASFEVKADENGLEVYETRLTLPKGERRFAAAFVNDYYNKDAPDPYDRDRNMFIASLEVVGPVDVPEDELPATHRRIVTCRPDGSKSVNDCAGQILGPFATRAFRRPVQPDELDRLVKLVELAVEQGDSFERGLQVAVSAVLVSPHFVFRIERDALPGGPADHAIGDYELASRLSYFLWSTMPDDELRSLADGGALRRPDVLQQQVRRMLADRRASALAQNFGGQWLNLRNLDEITPDPAQFPTWNSELRDDMRRETELFFEEVMRRDRSILDFINGSYTFVNARLAQHYGLASVDGDEFRQVSLTGSPRAGLLTHASILTLTSNPGRTSPVKRGKWIMENILGTRPPDPPPDVPQLEETQKAAPNASLREQLELHRKDPACASCHQQMDALGFGFENFDAVGRWRDSDGKFPIDASATLPGGESFRGPTELVRILGERKEQFSRALAERMLTYALGRGLEYYDRCAVDRIVDTLAKNDYRFSQLVSEIVLSKPFRMRRGEGDTHK